MEINCIAIDDEPLALKKVASFIEKTSGLKLVERFDNALEAIPFMKENRVDLVFLDIQMEGFTGIQFLESVKNPPQVILTTAYEQYALKGFDFHVTDYLLKPYSFERFVQAVDRVMDNLKKIRGDAPAGGRDFMFVKTEYRFEMVFLDEILYVEGMRDYLRIVTKTRKILTHQTLRFMEGKLKPPMFVRVHKSFLVSVSSIESIERNTIKVFNQRIPVGNAYRDDFFAAIAGRMPPKPGQD